MIELTTWESILCKYRIKAFKTLKDNNIFNALTYSEQHRIFMEYFKRLLDKNIFKFSSITYLSLSFLDKYININVYKYIFKESIVEKLDSNYTTYLFVKLIVNITVELEITLNLHLFIILNFLNRINQKNAILQTSNKTDVFYKFTKIYSDMLQFVAPSNMILLLFKLIRNTNIYNSLSSDIISKLFETYSESKKNELSNKFKVLIKKQTSQMTIILDTFMLKINMYFFDDGDCDIYGLCVNYVFDQINIVFKNYTELFDMFVDYIIFRSRTMFTAIPTNSDVKDDYENDMKNLQHIKSSIKNLLETEIINARLKFFEI
jgi:hypothetical protein